LWIDFNIFGHNLAQKTNRQKKGRTSLKKKVVVFSLVAVMLLGVSLGAGLYFSDHKVSFNNVFASGTLTLEVTTAEESDVVISYENLNLKPGDTGGWDGVSWGDDYLRGLAYQVTNTGTLAGTVTVSLTPSDGEEDWGLGKRIRPQVRVNGTWKTESSGFHNLNPFTFDLEPGETALVQIAWSFQPSGNEWQDQEVNFDINFDIRQAN